MQPERKTGPGAATPEPLCIAYLANALVPYAFDVVEGNRKAVRRALKRNGGILAVWSIDLADQPPKQAEAPENAL
jgi:hypothetical protein